MRRRCGDGAYALAYRCKCVGIWQQVSWHTAASALVYGSRCLGIPIPSNASGVTMCLQTHGNARRIDLQSLSRARGGAAW